MIDRSDFKPEHHELWDEMFPDGIEQEPTERDMPHMRLYAFGYVCMFDLGSVPESVTKELKETPRLVTEYMSNRKKAG